VLGVAGVILLPLLATIIVHLYNRRVAAQEVREAVAELDAADPGWRFEDIQATWPVIPDEQNGALRVRAAAQLLPKDWPEADRPRRPVIPAELRGLGLRVDPQPEGPNLDEMLRDLESPEQLNEGQIRQLRDTLRPLAPAVTAAHKVAECLDGRAAVDWRVFYMETLLPHVVDARRVGKLLHYDAALKAQDGDLAGAWESGRATLHVARSLGEEPMLLTLLSRYAIAYEGCRSLERTLAQGEPPEAALPAVQQLLRREDQETPSLLRSALRGERALLHRFLAALESGALSLSTLGDRSPSAWRNGLGDVLSANMVRHSHAVALRHFTALDEACRLPQDEQLPRLKEVERHAPDRATAPIAALLTPAMSKIVATTHRQQALLRCAVVAVALERYRQEHNRWPESLAALIPAELDQIPTDPYNGQPLRFRLLDDGPVVYSVGPDGEDNGGNLDRRHPIDEGTDLGFRLWDFAKRCQPPRPAEPAPEGR
jgi:hypothetical protein